MTAMRPWAAASTAERPPTAERSSIIASLEARVADQPWRTLGGAFLLGAWVGLDPPRAPRNTWVRAGFAIIGSITLRVVREVALRELAAWARPRAHEQRTGPTVR
jgi:hypothetical protein